MKVVCAWWTGDPLQAHTGLDKTLGTVQNRLSEPHYRNFYLNTTLVSQWSSENWYHSSLTSESIPPYPFNTTLINHDYMYVLPILIFWVVRYLNNYVLCPHQCSTSYTMLKKNYETSTDRIYSLTSFFFYPPPLLQFKVAWFGTFYLIHSFLSEYSVTSVQSNSILHSLYRHIQYSTDHIQIYSFLYSIPEQWFIAACL